jgi:hypothetical protein
MTRYVLSMLLVSWVIAIPNRVEAQETDSSGKASRLRKGYIEVPRVDVHDESKSSIATVQVELRFQLVRLNNEKMRSMGFDVKLATGDEHGLTVLGEAGRGESIANFIESMCENELATTLAEPTIVTVTGRQADLRISKQTRLSCIPRFVDEKLIRVDVGLMSAADQPNRDLTAHAEIKADGIVVFSVPSEAVRPGPLDNNHDAYVLIMRPKPVIPVAASPALERR